MKICRKAQVVKVDVSEDEKLYLVMDEHNWVWSEATTARGAVQGAVACMGGGENALRKINFNGFKVGRINL